MFRAARGKCRGIARWGATLLAIGIASAPGLASAVSFDLDVEFDTGQTGIFGVVNVEESGGDLYFDIRLDPSLGDDADLHVVYFNLLGSFTGLAITTTDAPQTPYELSIGGPTRGGAGADFEYAVNFGNGGSSNGNGRLKRATFTLSADQPLAIEDLLKTTLASGRSIEISFAAHVQGTSLFPNARSETVGGVVPVPEPSTASLLGLGLGLLGVARVGRRRSA